MEEHSPKRIKIEDEGMNGDESNQDDSLPMETDKVEESSAQTVGFNLFVIHLVLF